MLSGPGDGNTMAKEFNVPFTRSRISAQKVMVDAKINETWCNMDVSENSGFSPPIIHFNRVFHYFHHPFWGTPFFGNTHMQKMRSDESPMSPLLASQAQETLPKGGCRAHQEFWF